MSLFSSRTSIAEPAPQSLLSLRELARTLDRHAEQLCKWAKRPDFPRHPGADGKPLYLAAEVEAWIAANVRTRKPAPASDPPSPQPPRLPAPAQMTRPPGSKTESSSTSPQPAMPPGPAPAYPATDDPLRQTLTSGQADALEINRAAMHLAAHRVGMAEVASSREMDDLKKILSEMRNCEAATIELETRRGQLIPRDQVKLIIADCCARLLRLATSLENALAIEFSQWLADPKIAAMSSDERQREVRAFVNKSARQLLVQEADDIDRIINKPRTDQ